MFLFLIHDICLLINTLSTGYYNITSDHLHRQRGMFFLVIILCITMSPFKASHFCVDVRLNLRYIDVGTRKTHSKIQTPQRPKY